MNCQRIAALAAVAVSAMVVAVVAALALSAPGSKPATLTAAAFPGHQIRVGGLAGAVVRVCDTACHDSRLLRNFPLRWTYQQACLSFFGSNSWADRIAGTDHWTWMDANALGTHMSRRGCAPERVPGSMWALRFDLYPGS
jgi:hypothetical protein